MCGPVRRVVASPRARRAISLNILNSLRAHFREFFSARRRRNFGRRSAAFKSRWAAHAAHSTIKSSLLAPSWRRRRPTSRGSQSHAVHLSGLFLVWSRSQRVATRAWYASLQRRHAHVPRSEDTQVRTRDTQCGQVRERAYGKGLERPAFNKEGHTFTGQTCTYAERKG